MDKKYGIISGYGTLAGIIFQQYLHTLTHARLQPQTDADFPNYMILNFPTDVLTNTGESNNTDAETVIKDAAEIINPHTTHTMILCNTLHAHSEAITTHLPNNISLVEIVSEAITEYENPLILTSVNNSAYRTLNPQRSMLAVPELITSVITNTHNTSSVKEQVKTLFAEHPNHDAYVLACTELPALRELFESEKPAHAHIVDCLEVAAEHIITLEETK